MEKPLVTIVHQNDSLSRLEIILRRFGLHVRTFSDVCDLVSAAGKDRTGKDFVFLDRPSAEALLPLRTFGGRQLILVTEEKGCTASAARAGEFVELSQELEDLHRFLQENHLTYSRRHLRAEIKLPSVFSLRGVCHVAEILSLGTGGAFVKTGWKHIGKDDLVEICIPLLGMQRELELVGSVVYQVEPSEDNNYLQGFGVRFRGLEAELSRAVEEYIKLSLSRDFDDHFGGREEFGSPLPSYAASRSRPAPEGRLCLKG